MRIVYSDAHRGHDGAKEMRYDQMIPMCENPSRMDVIVEALRAQGHRDFADARSFGLEPVLRIHTPGFVDFLERCSPLWEAEFGTARTAFEQQAVVPVTEPTPASAETLAAFSTKRSRTAT